MSKSPSPLSVMIDNFLNNLNGKPPASLTDHIRRDLAPSRQGDYKSYRSQCIMRLKPGGSHNHLVGATVFSSINARGPSPTWCGSTPPMEDLIPEPDWTKANELVAINDTQISLGVAPEVSALTIRTLSSLPARKYKILTNWANEIVQVAETRTIERDEVIGHNTRLQKEAQAKDKTISRQHALLERLERVLGTTTPSPPTDNGGGDGVGDDGITDGDGSRFKLRRRRAA